MWDPTAVTWILLAFGWVFVFVPMLYAQTMVTLAPHGRRAKNVVIGKDEDWRDDTHFRGARGFAMADLGIWLPLLAAGSVGVILGEAWGYVLWASSGVVSLYINVVLWFLEREYVYRKAGALRYYTYFWGFFVYWGAAVVVYSVLRAAGVEV